MDWSERVAGVFGLDDAGWARHANPWSGATRFPVLPVAAALLLVRESLGWWLAPLLALTVAWAFLNPHAFARPTHARHWMSRAVLGEWLWIKRRRADAPVAVPAETRCTAACWTAAQAAGTVPLIWGLVIVSPWLTFLGCAAVIGAKLAFLDVLVRFYDRHGGGRVPWRAGDSDGEHAIAPVARADGGCTELPGAPDRSPGAAP
ncbi:MAG: DUF6653 family protein [Pseudomonadota bacterium]